MPAPVLEHIVQQHAEDGAFLWLLRQRAAQAPHDHLRELARLDERIEAHLDGLRVAGPHGWDIARTGLLDLLEPGEAFIAAVLAMESRDLARLGEVLAVTECRLERPVISALGWLEPQALRGIVPALLRDSRPYWRRLGVATCSIHRVDPGAHLPSLLQDVPEVRARSLRLAGELGRVDLLPSLLSELTSPDPACRFWSAWSATLLGNRREAPAVLRELAAADGPGWLGFRLLLPTLPGQAAMEWLRSLPRGPEGDRLRVAGAGLIGDSTLIPWLISQMEEEALARLAGEAVTMITGLDFEEAGLAASPPAEGDGQDLPTSSEALGADWDDPLIWPDAAKLRDWWTRARGTIPKGVRLFLGRTASPHGMSAALDSGTQRQRRQAAVELALMQPGLRLANCSARVRSHAAKRSDALSN